MRVCANITPFDVSIPVLEGGFHYVWGQGGEVDYPGCKGNQSDYKPAAFGAALNGRIAAANHIFKVAANTPSETVRLDGALDAPAAILVDPNGRHILTPAPPANGASGDGFKAVRMPSQRRTYVVLDKPMPGIWQVLDQPGSSITAVATSEGLPAPSVTGKVGGKGHARTLDYRVRGVEGQSVRLFERGGEVSRSIGVLKPGHHTLKFGLADGKAGTRQLVAIVQSQGLPRAQIVVASFRLPARPGRASRAASTSHGTGRSCVSRGAPPGVPRATSYVPSCATGGARSSSPEAHAVDRSRPGHRLRRHHRSCHRPQRPRRQAGDRHLQAPPQEAQALKDSRPARGRYAVAAVFASLSIASDPMPPEASGAARDSSAAAHRKEMIRCAGRGCSDEWLWAGSSWTA